MKLFISQPMNGRSDEEILAERENAIEYVKVLTGEEVEVLDSLFDFPDGTHPLYSLAKSLEMLSQADLAYFCAGWDTARGCMIEHRCAVEYGIDALTNMGETEV